MSNNERHEWLRATRRPGTRATSRDFIATGGCSSTARFRLHRTPPTARSSGWWSPPDLGRDRPPPSASTPVSVSSVAVPSMSNIHTPVNEELWDYIRRVSLREPDVLRRIREATASHPHVSCQIAAEQGQFMALLIHLIGAKRTLEVGVFTGYSSTAVALALPDDGRIVACDVNAEWTAIARRFWREAGVEHKIDLRLGPALKTLDRLLAEGQAGKFRFRLHRRGQGELRRLLRARPATGARGRTDCHR